MSAGIPNCRGELIEEGIVAHLDYATGRSVDPNDVRDDNNLGKNAIDTLAEFSKVGGYFFGHTDGLGRVIVGRARPGSIRIETVEKPDSTVHLKCIQLDAFGEVRDDEFEGLWEMANDSFLRQRPLYALNPDKHANKREQIAMVVTVLERENRLSYR
jgi:hypothetical protein